MTQQLPVRLRPGAVLLRIGFAEPLPDLAGKLVAEVAVEEVVEVLAARLLVAAGPADDLERVAVTLQDRRVEGAPAEVVDGDVLAPPGVSTSPSTTSAGGSSTRRS